MKQKLTKSCSRCRQKKLKCDNQVPCQHCSARGLEHECRKDVRQPRKKRTVPSASAAELQEMRNRISQMEEQLYRAQSSEQQDDDDNSVDMATEDDEKEVENAAELLEHFATSTAAEAEAAGLRGKILMPPYVRSKPNAWWSKPENHAEFEQLKAEVRADLSTITAEGRNEAVTRYAKWRASTGTGNVIHYISFVDFIETFLLGDALAVDADDVAAICMVFASGLLFHPGDEPRYTERFAGHMDASLSLAWKDGRLHSRMVHQGQRALAADRNPFIGSLNGISAGIHLLAHCPKDEASSVALEDQLIRSARHLGYDKLGVLPGLGFSDGASLEVARNTELAVRAWHHLVQRDWAQSQKTLYYRIMPEHFDTRRPLLFDDSDLMALPFPPEKSRMERTNMSSTLERLRLADLVRTSVDLLPAGSRTLNWTAANRARLETMYSQALADLPPFFSLDIDEPPRVDALRDMQRASLHQLYFDLLLKLHRSQLGKAGLAPSVVMLANRILDIQGRVNSVCRVIDSLWLQQSLVFSACIVLVLELYADQPDQYTGTSSSTLMTRSRVRNAIMLLNQNNPKVARGARLLHALLDEEEKRPANANRSHPQSRRAGLRAAIQLATAIDRDRRASEAQTSPTEAEPGPPLPRDMDLMPTLQFDTSEPSIFSYSSYSPLTHGSTVSSGSNAYTPEHSFDYRTSDGKEAPPLLPLSYDPTVEDVDALLWQWLSSNFTEPPTVGNAHPAFSNNGNGFGHNGSLSGLNNGLPVFSALPSAAA